MVYSKYYLHFSDRQQSKSLKVTQLMKAEQSFDKGNLKHLSFTLWKCFTNFFFISVIDIALLLHQLLLLYLHAACPIIYFMFPFQSTRLCLK